MSKIDAKTVRARAKRRYLSLLHNSERLRGFEWRQYAGEPGRQHRLAGAGRADHQEVVATGRGDFEGALGAFLALDVPEVEHGGARRRQLRLGRRQQLSALEVIDDGEKARRGDDLDLAGPGRLAAAVGRANETALAPGGGQRGEQHAG